MQNTEEFQIADTTYRYTRLKPKKVMKGMRCVSPAFAGDIDAAMGNAEELLDLFAGTTEIQHEDPGNGTQRWMPLKTQLDHHFTGRPGAMVAYLMKCIVVEYGDFLPGAAGHEAVMEVVSQFSSLMDATGSSGES